MVTQFGRALAQLGIRHIAAYSPEARGRSERAFAIAPEQADSAFLPDGAGQARAILCIQEERRVGNDNTAKWRGLILRIPPNPLRPHFVRATVRVHEYPDGRLAVFRGPHRLANYHPEGTLCDDAKLAA